MSRYLLDTNVLSELIKKRPAKSVVERVGRVRGEDLATSAICVTELRYGAVRHPEAEALWDRICEKILPRVRIMPLGEDEARCAGDVLAALAGRGEPIGLEDVLIGATALTHGLTVVTRNTRHFVRIDGLSVESWWPKQERI